MKGKRQVLGTVCAINTDPDSENRIHSDLGARKYGFAAGLVPGVEIFQFLAGAALSVEPGWLKSGWGHLELKQPYYDGEPVTIALSDDGRVWAGDRVVLSVEPRPDLKAKATVPKAVLVRGGSHRPEASPESLAEGTVLGALYVRLKDPAAGSRKAKEMLEFANQILMRNVRLEPWLHVESEIRWYSLAETIETFEVRGRVEREWETKKGHRMVRIRVEYCDPATQDLAAAVEHTAVWRLAAL
ncbi:hypothetical protein F183_A14400 [Bryobacterales bacterium F-183]|nr:hypothetical protein F183_A14400 [Bryobacterales bacterium F-183]